MKTCAYCGKSIEDKRKNAKYCSNICRIKAYRNRHGIDEPFQQEKPLNPPKNVISFTCCENGHFYSPVGRWGEILICDNCGAVWGRLDNYPRITKTTGKKDD